MKTSDERETPIEHAQMVLLMELKRGTGMTVLKLTEFKIKTPMPTERNTP